MHWRAQEWMLSVDNLFVFRFHRWNLGPHGSRGFSKEAQPTFASPPKKVVFLDELNSKFSGTCLVGILIFGWKMHVSCQIYKMTFCDTSCFWKMSSIGGPLKEPMFKKHTRSKFFTFLMPLMYTFKDKFPSKSFWILASLTLKILRFTLLNPWIFSWNTRQAKSCQEHFPDLSYTRYTQESRLHSDELVMKFQP